MKITIHIATLFFVLVFTHGCKKKGCTNACAYNYESQAEKDDGSCVIKLPVVSFWSDGNSHGYINISIDSNQNGKIDLGEHFGTLAYGFNTTPFCGQYNTVKHELPPGNYYYLARASNNLKTWEGTFTLTDCNCTLVKLPN